MTDVVLDDEVEADKSLDVFVALIIANDQMQLCENDDEVQYGIVIAVHDVTVNILVLLICDDRSYMRNDEPLECRECEVIVIETIDLWIVLVVAMCRDEDDEQALLDLKTNAPELNDDFENIDIDDEDDEPLALPITHHSNDLLMIDDDVGDIEHLDVINDVIELIDDEAVVVFGVVNDETDEIDQLKFAILLTEAGDLFRLLEEIVVLKKIDLKYIDLPLIELSYHQNELYQMQIFY